MQRENDPFEVLGLKRGASAEEVRRRYRELARRYHPDVNEGDSTAEWMFKQVNAAHEALVGNATAQRPQSPPRSPPRPPAPPEPPTASSWTPPKPVDDLAAWVFIDATMTAVMAAQIAGWLAEATSFTEELAVLLESILGRPASPTHARVATMLATTFTLAATVAVRHEAWRESKPTPWRPALQALKALAWTAAAATGGAAALTLLSRYVAQ